MEWCGKRRKKTWARDKKKGTRIEGRGSKKALKVVSCEKKERGAYAKNEDAAAGATKIPKHGGKSAFEIWWGGRREVETSCAKWQCEA